MKLVSFLTRKTFLLPLDSSVLLCLDISKLAMASSAVAGRFGKLISKNTALFLCDMQERFRPSIKFFDQIVQNSNRMLRCAMILEMPVVVTEQYPKGLGSTVSEIGLANYPQIAPVAKTRFTMCLEEPLKALSAHPDVNCILLCGIEAHVCIQQTAIDLRSKGFEVFVVVDACSSRGHAERVYAYELLKQAGCWMTTAESAILGLTGGSCHPRFKELQAIIKEEAPDTGLVRG